jgi:hypothetical protein
VDLADCFRAFQVGQGQDYFQDALAGARRQVDLVRRLLEEFLNGCRRLAVTPDACGVQLRIEPGSAAACSKQRLTQTIGCVELSDRRSFALRARIGLKLRCGTGKFSCK